MKLTIRQILLNCLLGLLLAFWLIQSPVTALLALTIVAILKISSYLKVRKGYWLVAKFNNDGSALITALYKYDWKLRQYSKLEEHPGSSSFAPVLEFNPAYGYEVPAYSFRWRMNSLIEAQEYASKLREMSGSEILKLSIELR